jgi:hypothetical protein
VSYLIFGIKQQDNVQYAVLYFSHVRDTADPAATSTNARDCPARGGLFGIGDDDGLK